MHKLSTLTAVLLLSGGLTTAQAATSRDVATNGTGDVVFQIFDDLTDTTLNWDLATASSDLTAVDFYSGAVSSVSLANSALDGFLAGVTNLSTLRWRVLGVSEVQSASPFTTPSPNYGAVMTQIAEPDVSSLRSSSVGADLVTVLGPHVAAVGTGGVDTNGGFDGVANSDDAKLFIGGSQGFGAFSQTQFTGTANALVGLGVVDFYYLQRDPAAVSQVATGTVLATRLGTWSLNFDGAEAVLSYAATAVPAPAALWLLGSALAGLASLRRRRG